MNFKFNEDEQKVIDLIHKFGVNEVAPLAAEIDEQERFPEDEYSCAVKPHIRAGGNRQSGIQETVIASLLA